MNGQLNGWFGSFIKKAINFVAERVDSYLDNLTFGISSEIGSFQALTNTIGSGGSEFWQDPIRRTTYDSIDLSVLENDPRGNYEPTIFEEEILNFFLDEFSKVVSSISEMTIGISTLSNSEKITTSNKILERIAIVKGYYASNQKKGLSIEALDLRNLIIEVLFLKIEQLVRNEVATTGAIKMNNQMSIPLNTIDFLYALQPLQKRALIGFKVDYYIFQQKDGNVLPVDLNPINTDPTNPTGTTTTTTTTTETPTKKGSSTGAKIIGGSLLALLLAKLIRK